MIERLLYNAMIGLIFISIATRGASDNPLLSTGIMALVVTSYALYLETYRMLLRSFFKQRYWIFGGCTFVIIGALLVRFDFDLFFMALPLVASMLQMTLKTQHYNQALNDFKANFEKSDE